jgi:hypothetical protein
MESDMTKQPTLRQLFEIGCHNAKRIFLERGEISPMWHAVPEDNEHLLIATPWSDDVEKEIAIEFLREEFRRLKVQRFVCVVEAWAVVGSDLKTLTEVRPSQHPDRREVIKIQAEDRDGSALSGQYYILRPEHGPATLSPLHEDPPDMIAAGRMTGLLVGTRH